MCRRKREKRQRTRSISYDDVDDDDDVATHLSSSSLSSSSSFTSEETFDDQNGHVPTTTKSVRAPLMQLDQNTFRPVSERQRAAVIRERYRVLIRDPNAVPPSISSIKAAMMPARRLPVPPDISTLCRHYLPSYLWGYLSLERRTGSLCLYRPKAKNRDMVEEEMELDQDDVRHLVKDKAEGVRSEYWKAVGRLEFNTPSPRLLTSLSQLLRGQSIAPPRYGEVSPIQPAQHHNGINSWFSWSNQSSMIEMTQSKYNRVDMNRTTPDDGDQDSASSHPRQATPALERGVHSTGRPTPELLTPEPELLSMPLLEAMQLDEASTSQSFAASSDDDLVITSVKKTEIQPKHRLKRPTQYRVRHVLEIFD